MNEWVRAFGRYQEQNLRIHPTLIDMTEQVARELNEEMHWQSIIPPRRRQETQTAVMDRPGPVPFVLPPNAPPPAYLERAARVKLDSPPIVAARLENWLALHGCPVYNLPKVEEYLYQVARRDAAREGAADRSGVAISRQSETLPYWAPLRTVDRCDEFTLPWGSWGSVSKAPVYDRYVPAHALDKVETLEADLGERVLKFAVSDYAVVKPDPFLMVLAGHKRYVIDVWDEPGW
jgi:hypothetical protein